MHDCEVSRASSAGRAAAGEAGADSCGPAEMNPKLLESVVFAQLLPGCLLAALACIYDWVIAGSILLGGLISALPSAYMVQRVRMTVRAEQAFQVLTGELGRLALTAAGFALVFALGPPVRPEVLIGSFLLAQMSCFLAPLWSRRGS